MKLGYLSLDVNHQYKQNTQQREIKQILAIDYLCAADRAAKFTFLGLSVKLVRNNTTHARWKLDKLVLIGIHYGGIGTVPEENSRC